MYCTEPRRAKPEQTTKTCRHMYKGYQLFQNPTPARKLAVGACQGKEVSRAPGDKGLPINQLYLFVGRKICLGN